MRLPRDLSVTLQLKMLSFYLAAFLWFFGLPEQGNAPVKPVVRSCPDSWADAALGGKKKAASGKKNTRRESGACIELAFPALEIQEYLQSLARKERWVLSADQLTVDSWTFSLEIDKEALLRDTAAEAIPKGIDWTHGSIRVQYHQAPRQNARLPRPLEHPHCAARDALHGSPATGRLHS